MPWNAWMRSTDEDHRRRTELVLLAEAAGGTIGPVARAAGFRLNVGACGHGEASPGGRVIAVLYEADATGFWVDHAGRGADPGTGCIDLWIEWFTDIPRVEVRLSGFDGLRSLEEMGQRDLIAAARGPVRTGEALHLALSAYSEALRRWLEQP